MTALTLPGTLDALAPLGDFVKAAAAAAGLDPKAAYRLRLAVVELVTNSVTHGYAESGTTGPVRLTADVTPDALVVTVEDDAPPFDPSAAPPPDDLDRPLEERDIGGLGVYLVLQEVDEYRYERAGRANRSVLRMRRPGAG